MERSHYCETLREFPVVRGTPASAGPAIGRGDARNHRDRNAGGCASLRLFAATAEDEGLPTGGRRAPTTMAPSALP